MVRSRADIRSLSTASLQAMVFAEGAYDPGKYKHSTVGRKELETRADAMVVESRRAWNAAADSASAAMVTAAAATASASSSAAEGSGGAAAAAASALSTDTTSTESKGRAAWARSLVQAWAAAVAEAATEVGKEADLQEELEAVEDHLAGVIENASRRGMAASSENAQLPPLRRANLSTQGSSSPTPSSAGATAPPMTLPAALEAAGSLADGFKADGNSNDVEEASDGSDNDEEAGKDNGSKHGSATVKHNKKGKKKKGKKGRLGGRNGRENPSEPSTTSSKSYSSAAAQALVVVHRVTALQQRAALVLAHRAHPLWPRVLKVAVDASATASAALEDQDNAARRLASTMSTATIDKPPVANNLDGPTPAEPLLPGAPPRGEAEAMMAQFLSLNCKLVRELVRGLPGPDHPDLASTYHDLANGLKALLRRQPSAFELTAPPNAAEGRARPVTAASNGDAETGDDLSDDDMDDEPSFPPLEWASVALANQAEQRERRNHERVRALYSGR